MANELLGTWVFNKVIKDYNEIDLIGVHFHCLTEPNIEYSSTTGGGMGAENVILYNDTIVYEVDKGWVNEKYRTIVITSELHEFLHEQHLKILKANATKVTNDRTYRIGKLKITGWIKEYAKGKGNSLDSFFKSFNANDMPIKNLIEYSDTSEITNMSKLFWLAQLPEVPLFDTSKVQDMSHMFNNCTALKDVPAFNCISCTNMEDMFFNCINVETLDIININCNLNISACTKLQQAQSHKVIDNLLPQTSTKTLTLGSTLLSRVSEEYKEKARQKGWTLA